jgi:hypothetical protein
MDISRLALDLFNHFLQAETEQPTVADLQTIPLRQRAIYRDA